MAVEAHHLNPFPPQFIGNREMISPIEGNANMFNTQHAYGLTPLSGTTSETLFPVYSQAITDSFPAKTAMKADSGLTHALPVSRKRSGDSIHPLPSFPHGQNLTRNNRCGSYTFLGEDISLQIQQQQLVIDRFIAQHTEKLRLEIEERRKRYSSRIITAFEGGIMKKLKSKEEEIEKIGKLNWALEERVRSLCIENQIWRDLAQSNEATANALRSNLEQVLAQVKDKQQHRYGADLDEAAALMDDAQSCCGSNNGANEEDCRSRGDRNLDKGDDDCASISRNRWCRNCRKEESCVLLLPCRHLCLCTVCGSSVHICPICKSSKNASLHINMSS